MKKSKLREIIGNMLKEILMEEPNEISLNNVRKKGQTLKLRIQTSNVSWGYAVKVFDLKDTGLNSGSISPKSPEYDDFIKRLKKLKDFVGKQNVKFKGNKVTGLQKK